MRRRRGTPQSLPAAWLTMMLLLAWVLSASAATGKQAVSRAQLYRMDDGLFCDLHLHDLFPEEIANTLCSGLPVVFDLGLELRVFEQVRAHTYFLRQEAAYDVWDDVFSLTRGGETGEYGDFEALAGAASLVEGLRLISTRNLPDAARIKLDIRLAISPLSGEERARMSRWLSRTVGEASDPSARELRLDLGGLIGGFFKRDESEGAWGGRSELGPWRLSDLPRREAPPTGGAAGGSTNASGASGSAASSTGAAPNDVPAAEYDTRIVPDADAATNESGAAPDDAAAEEQEAP